ncbi:protein FAR1-RELATED SEQUENCE 5-like [Silene latifolia]|uniref:protein FAR1-RELATED SEQUENCE 5-like n=1 Tax=Silene latifolia TaxID=37657 RepID=UPI003D770981
MSSYPNDIHVSAIISNDSNDILESSITSTVHIESPNGPNSTPHVEQHFVPSRVHQLLLDSTPGGSELWTRKVALEFKPHIGQFFGTLEEAISFYGVYAEACGFEPWKFSQKRSSSADVQYKFVVCNREGFIDRKRKAIVLHSGEEQANPKPFDIRNTKLTMIGCSAMIEFRYNGDGHLHPYHKKTIMDQSRVNQGPTTTFKILKEYVDGYENVGAQLVDLKNFGRDIKCFIGDRDVQLFVNHFEDKCDTNEGFYFAYKVDSGKCLVRAFWCDAKSRRNYSLFGDYITYDPTYSTNKYCIVFTPFTGVHHHKRSVTFAATLLFHEDEDSFMWVFEKFLDVLGQRESHCIITDQCAGIRKGLRAVFKHARRRYCMWHIMQKLTDKVGPAISKETDFVSRLNAIVWDDELEPLEFVEKWSQLVNEHNLEEATASICSLSVGGFTPPANGIEVIGIADARTQKTYQIVYNSITNDVECSCKLFNRKGIICRHIIWVYSGKQVDTLPDKNILMRWTKNAHKFYATTGVLKNVPTNEITDLVDTLKQFRVKLNPQSESTTKEQELEMLLGCSSSTEGSSDEDDADDGLSVEGFFIDGAH